MDDVLDLKLVLNSLLLYWYRDDQLLIHGLHFGKVSFHLVEEGLNCCSRTLFLDEGHNRLSGVGDLLTQRST